MRGQLIQYVDLLFAGTKGSEDIKQEILQNTLDRYDDLILEGKSPEAAYRLAILSIGDINEILGSPAPAVPVQGTKKAFDDRDTPTKKLLRAIAVGLYILCPVPVILLGGVGSGILGVCLMFLTIAVATVLIILASGKEEEEKEAPKSELEKSINKLVWAIGLAVYFVISFATGAWYITWLMFPIIGAVQGLIKAIIDLKEATKP